MAVKEQADDSRVKIGKLKDFLLKPVSI